MQPQRVKATPKCPTCDSDERVVRMIVSLTPFERPWMREESDQWFCQACGTQFAAHAD